MKTKNKEVYYCDHCGKHGLSKHFMVRHEKICHKNKDNNRPCFDCEFLEKKQTKILSEYCFGSDCERAVDLFFCKSKKTFLYTPQNEVKGNRFELSDDENNPMPKECSEFKKLTNF